MLKIAIVDSNYNDGVTHGLSAQWLRWELGRLNVTPCDLPDADFIFLTCSCPQNHKDAKKSLAGMKKGARVILGGAAALQPAVFDDFIHVACVGEGHNWIKTFVNDGYEAALSLQNSYIPGETRHVIPDTEFTFDVPPIQSLMA